MLSTTQQLQHENRELRARLEEAEETLRAIRNGEIDALVVTGAHGNQVYTLQSAEQPYRLLVEQMQEGALTLSAEGIILYANQRFAQMLQRPHEQIVASAAQSYVAEEHKERFASLLTNGAKRSARTEITLCTGEGHFLSTYITASPAPAEVEGYLCMIVTDLTELESLRQKQAEIEELNIRLRRSMMETHHRVKNNLQTIAALIEMQAMEGTQTRPIEDFLRLRQQVIALAVVHDLLTSEAMKDGEVYSLSVRTLLQKLLTLLQTTIGTRPIHARLEDIVISVRQGTSMALVTNELVGNAIKHGAGAIEVALRAHAGEAVLQVADDGPGFPSEFTSSTAKSTGLFLVENLSRHDLKGKVQYENKPQGGALVTVTVPLPG